MTTVVKFVSRVARVVANDALLLLMSDRSSLFGLLVPINANWFAWGGVFHALVGGGAMVGVVRILSVPKLIPSCQSMASWCRISEE